MLVCPVKTVAVAGLTGSNRNGGRGLTSDLQGTVGGASLPPAPRQPNPGHGERIYILIGRRAAWRRAAGGGSRRTVALAACVGGGSVVADLHGPSPLGVTTEHDGSITAVIRHQQQPHGGGGGGGRRDETKGDERRHNNKLPATNTHPGCTFGVIRGRGPLPPLTAPLQRHGFRRQQAPPPSN